MRSLSGGTTTMFPERRSGERMIVTEHKTTKVISLYWDDLSASAKERLIEILGDNGNYDVFPLAEIEFEKEKKDHEQSIND